MLTKFPRHFLPYVNGLPQHDALIQNDMRERVEASNIQKLDLVSLYIKLYRNFILTSYRKLKKNSTLQNWYSIYTKRK